MKLMAKSLDCDNDGLMPKQNNHELIQFEDQRQEDQGQITRENSGLKQIETADSNRLK